MTAERHIDGERRIAVFGAGAVGGYLGARLALALIDPPPSITLIGRAPVVDAVRTRGLILREDGLESCAQVEAVTSAADLPPFDLVLLAVRTYDVAAALPDIRRMLGPDGLVLALQNGVGTEERVGDAVGREHTVVGTITVRAAQDAPGVISRQSSGGGVALAPMSGELPKWLLAAFGATGLPTVVLDDYRSLRWSKLLLNMLGAATTAILDMDIGEVMTSPQLFRLDQRAFREAGRVMDAQGIPTVDLPGYPVTLARKVMRLPRPLTQRLLAGRIAGARDGRSPTMRDDMERGRTEVAAFNGAVAAAGQRIGIPTPVNAALAALTTDLAAHPHRRDELRGRPDRLLAAIRATS